MVIHSCKELHFLSGKFLCCNFGYTAFFSHVDSDRYIDLTSHILDAVCNHFRIASLLCLPHSRRTSLCGNELHFLLSVPQGDTAKSHSLSNPVFITADTKLCLCLYGRIPLIIKKFHSSSILGIHVYRSAVIEVYTKSHVAVLDCRAMVSYLFILICFL